MQGRIVYVRMRQLIHVDVFGQANPAPYKAFWQNEDIRTAFLKDIYSSAVAVYIHQQLQYIFISSCSIYSSAVAVYIQLPMQYIFIFRVYYPVWSVLPAARSGR